MIGESNHTTLRTPLGRGLEAEYASKLPLFERLSNELSIQLRELLGKARIEPALPIHSRVKSWSSLSRKVSTASKQITSVDQVTDISGICIVLLFRRDAEAVERLIESNLKVLHKEDTGGRLKENEFGYGSVHFTVETPNTWLTLPTLKDLKGLRAEIQVRTASQHIWASVSHLLQYKREIDVPAPLKRAINRAAALLEIVDLEFERVLVERSTYIDEQASKTTHLNTDSLRSLLDSTWPRKNRASDEDYSEFLEELISFGVRSPEKLKKLLIQGKEAAMAREVEMVNMLKGQMETSNRLRGARRSRVRRGVHLTHVGLSRLALDASLKGWKTWRYKRFNARNNEPKLASS